MIAIYPGSFCPPTLGHADIIRRASGLFDSLIVAVLASPVKQNVFSPDERVDMLRRITGGLGNVSVISDDGMLIDVAKRCGAGVVIKGIRSAQDTDMEMQMASGNLLIGGIETLFMASVPEFSAVSSTLVRAYAMYGAPIDKLVPAEIIGDIYTKYGF